MTNKTIRVQGKGKVAQAPDQMRLTFSIIHLEPDFKPAVEGCNRRIEDLKRAATTVGILAGQLKTAQFLVKEQTEYQDGKPLLVGFQAIHVLTVVLPIDRDLIGNFLSEVMSSGAKPLIRINFEVTDSESLKQRVLSAAVENAKCRAETIATAAGVTLGGIEKIEYGYSEVRISTEECEMCIGESSEESFGVPELNPTEVEAGDTVTVTWQICQ